MARTSNRKTKSDTNKLFLDQVKYLNEQAAITGKSKASMIRLAIDEKFPEIIESKKGTP